MNIAEILKYCPKGTKLYSTVYGEVVLDHVCENGTHPIFCINEKHYKVFTKEGCLYENRGECILFPSREQRDWKKFKFPVKDGDIMMTIDKRAFIVNGKIDNDGCPCAHCGISLYHNFAMGTTTNGWTALFYIPASIEAMRELFNKMKKAGYRWNSETLELEKIEKVKFKPFDKVLVRNVEHVEWRISLFSSYSDEIYKYKCINGNYKYCIPYEGNEHLVGTNKDR